ncbi:MAG: CHAT domain-containing protein [Planctomycetota bacterium]|nr:CHAT domain-containing protein [Planctomycetota bacterium]
MRKAFGLVLLLLVAGHAAEARPEPDRAMRPAEAAQRVMDAVAQDDSDAVSTLAARVDPDPVLVADELFRRYAKAKRKPDAMPHDTSVYAEALEAFARAAAEHPAGEGLDALVAAWRDFDGPALESERRLRIALARTISAQERRDHARAIATSEVAPANPDQAPYSITAVRLWHTRCRSFVLTNRIDDAMKAARLATRQAARVGWVRGQATSLEFEGDLHARAGKPRPAIGALRRGLALRERAGDMTSVPIRMAQLAMFLLQTNENTEALDTVLDAVRRATVLEQHGVRGMALSIQGAIELEAGRIEDALSLFDQAQAALAEGRLPVGSHAVINVEYRLANAYQTLGRVHDALASLERVLAHARATQNQHREALVLSRLGGLYGQLGLHAKGLETTRRALDIAQRSRSRSVTERTRRQLAVMLRTTGRTKEAVTQLERALESAAGAADRTHEAYTRLELAKALGTLGRLADALEHGQRARDIYAELDMPLLAAGSSAVLGLLAIDAGEPDVARGHVEDVRRVIARVGDESAIPVSVREATARVLARLGEHQAALDLARRALDDALAAQRGLGEREAMGLRSMHASRLARVGVASALRLGGDEGPARALGFIEAARALLLAESLSNARTLLAYETTPELRADEADAREKVSALQAELVDATYAEEAKVASPRALKAALRRAHERLEDVRSRIERHARRIASIAMPRPVALADVQASLRPDEAYLAYQATSDRLCVLVVTNEDTELVALGEAATIGRRIEAYLDLVATPDGPEARLAGYLYDTLLAPIESVIGPRTQLLVSPDGILSYVPFGALLKPHGKARRRLVETHAVAFVPSATVLGFLRREEQNAPRGRGLLALADPAYGNGASRLGTSRKLSALPATREEANAIAAHFPESERTVLAGPAATVRDLRKALTTREGRWRAVHLAGHAFIDPERPRLSGLILADGEVLSAEAVTTLRIPAALAVLSACETGRGGYASGEGVLGLTRAFFHAGVPRVVVSSWKVPDEATRLLMADLYEALERRDLAPAEALRAAQRKAIQRGAHPYAWAAFMLWGLPR